MGLMFRRLTVPNERYLQALFVRSGPHHRRNAHQTGSPGSFQPALACYQLVATRFGLANHDRLDHTVGRTELTSSANRSPSIDSRVKDRKLRRLRGSS